MHDVSEAISALICKWTVELERDVKQVYLESDPDSGSWDPECGIGAVVENTRREMLNELRAALGMSETQVEKPLADIARRVYTTLTRAEYWELGSVAMETFHSVTPDDRNQPEWIWGAVAEAVIKTWHETHKMEQEASSNG